LQDAAIVFEFAFVILCVGTLLGLLAHAALHEDAGTRAVRVRSNAPHPSD
jgi:hypothetical protein